MLFIIRLLLTYIIKNGQIFESFFLHLTSTEVEEKKKIIFLTIVYFVIEK